MYIESYWKGWKLQLVLKRSKILNLCLSVFIPCWRWSGTSNQKPSPRRNSSVAPRSLPSASRLSSKESFALVWSAVPQRKWANPSRELQPQVLGRQTEWVLSTKEWLNSQPRERQRSRPLFFKKSLDCLMKLTIVNKHCENQCICGNCVEEQIAEKSKSVKSLK